MPTFNETIKASQASTNAGNYKLSLANTSKDIITLKYDSLFDKISVNSNNGNTSIKIYITLGQYAELEPILKELGYTVAQEPVITNNTVTTVFTGKLSSSKNALPKVDINLANNLESKNTSQPGYVYVISW